MVAYFTYYCKIKNQLKLIHSMRASNKQKDHSHFKLAVAMTATMGISRFFYFLSGLAEDLESRPLYYAFGTYFLLIQQSLMLLSSSKVARLCRERFCKT